LTWVVDGIYAAGWQHIPNTWGAFSEQTGIRAVFHLSRDRPQTFNGPIPAAFLWLSIEDESEADNNLRALAGEYIHSCREAGLSVLLHSASGRHRVRWAFVAHQLWIGRKLETVLRQAAEKPWLAPYHTDENLWRSFYEREKERSRLSHNIVHDP
jgi:hypothetical protein